MMAAATRGGASVLGQNLLGLSRESGRSWHGMAKRLLRSGPSDEVR